MSTRSDIQTWTKPLLKAYPQLALVGRNIVITPIRYFMRGIYIDRSSLKYSSPVICYITPLFDFHGTGIFFSPMTHLTVPFSDDPRFQDRLVQVCSEAIDVHLAPVRSVQDLFSAIGREPWFFDWSDITRHPLRHAVHLAGNGSLDAAADMLVFGLAKEKQTLASLMAHGEAEIARRSNSASGKMYVAQATRRLERVAILEQLLALVRVRDRAGIGAFLRAREHQEVKAWGAEHLWEPMPYPVEL